MIQKQFGTCEPRALAERDSIQELGCSDLAPFLFGIKKKFKKDSLYLKNLVKRLYYTKKDSLKKRL